MTLLIFYLILAIGFSFVCSILEAVILSVTPSFIEALEKRKPKRGSALRELKSDVDQPLAAILTLNTIAHTIGAAGVGAQALVVFGSGYVAVTSGVLTFLILVLSEIIPKTLGAYYWRSLAGSAAVILPPLIKILYPFVLLSRGISKIIIRRKQDEAINRDEIEAVVELAGREGLFRHRESEILKNIIRVKDLAAKDIMTPRTVIFTLPAEITVAEAKEKFKVNKFSRIPVYGDSPENINSFVLTKDIMDEISSDRANTKLKDIARDIIVIPETVPVISLFERMLNYKENICLIVDEYGGVAGIVSMEDILESLLGIEIVDETDTAEDMQEYARRKWFKRAGKIRILPEKGQKPKGKKGRDKK